MLGRSLLAHRFETTRQFRFVRLKLISRCDKQKFLRQAIILSATSSSDDLCLIIDCPPSEGVLQTTCRVADVLVRR
jgi:hypothetical protein